VSNTFLKLVQPIPLKGSLQIDEKELAEIESIAKRHNLFMLLYVQLQKYNKEISQNSDIQNYLKEKKPLFLSNAVQSVRQEVIEKEIINRLSAEQVPVIVMKGNEIAKEIYNDPNCRISVDIDILIKMSDALKADTILTEAGYSRTDEKPLGFWFSRLHHAVYIHPQKDDFIEVHWNFGIPSFFNLTSEEIWNEVVYTDSGQIKLSPDMMLILLLVHHHMHAFRELKILLDILWTLCKYENEIDWYAFSKKLKKIGLIKITQITLNQINSLWNESAQELQGFQTLDQEIKKMGYKKPAFLYSYFKMDIGNRDSYSGNKDVIVFRFALDRWSTIIFSFFKSIFPFPEAIKELYNDRRSWTLPKNYLRFIKWRLGEWRG
jgi:hypothetical protein